MKKALVIGGAGFIGSRIAKQMLQAGMAVTVIDGMLPHTGACIENLASVEPKIRFIKAGLEEVDQLDELLDQTDVVVASFGWTSHKAAFDQPLYDLELNLKAHIYLLENLKKAVNKPFVINLGSSVQFGKVKSKQAIGTDDEQYPLDVQGIHKIAAESYYRIFSSMYGLNIYSLRIPNCFGPNQKRTGEDIGLIGTFIRDALAGNEIVVFGAGRKRSMIYVDDLAKIIYRLATIPPNGFVALNLTAHHLLITELAREVIEIAGSGTLVQKELPGSLGKMDVAGTALDSTLLQNIVPDAKLSSLRESIGHTVNYFKTFK